MILESHLNPPEPIIAGKCACCHGDLYASIEYVKCVNTGRYYCDDHCYVEQQRDEGELTTEVIGD